MNAQTLVLRHGKLELPVCFGVAAEDAISPDAFLSDSESELLKGFQFAAKREGFLLGRLAAKRALGALLEEQDLRRIEIHSGIYGQPLARHPRAGSVQVTVSHSHGLGVALAFPAAYPMGIDLETLSAISAPAILGELQASPPELAWLASGSVDEVTACGVLWTAREALGKALKIGLNSPLGILALADIQAAGQHAWSGRYLRFPQCRFRSLATGGRVLTLAMPAQAELGGEPRLPL